MRSLSLRSGNSPTTPYGGRVNGLQILGFPPPCHPNYRALALTPAGLSPAERASLCWTHVGSRTGAPTVGSGGKSNHFRVGPQSGSHNHVSSPRLLKRSMRFSRTTLSCLLHVKGYAAYSAFAFTYIFRLRSCSSIGAFLISPLPPMSSKSLQTAGPLPSTGVTRLHRYYQPLRHPLACQPISRLPVIRPTFAPPISQRGEEGFSSCLARPRHRTVATTPPECRSASASLRYAMLLSSKT